MKKFFAILLCVVMVLAVVACNTPNEEKETETEKVTEKVTTAAPVVEEEEEEAAEYKLGMGIVVDMNESTTGNAQVDATFAAVVTDEDGKIVACYIDVAQNKYAIGTDTPAKEFQTKLERGDAYGMAAAVNFGMDWNNDGKVLEWYLQSEAFSKFVVGMTAEEVAAMETQVVEGKGYVISADEDLLTAGCTIQITSIKAVVAQAVENAR